MNKTKIIQDIVNHLKDITVNLETLIEVLDKTVNKEDSREQSLIQNSEVSPTAPKSESVTLEKVRAVLAAKSQGGKQPEVKALIVNHGANKLTGLDPSCYEELLKEAEEL